MRNIQYLTIDLNKKTQQDVTANEGEIGSRFLKIKITDNNVPIDLTGAKVYLYALKSDNTKLFNLVEIENATQGIVLAELTSQLLTSAGVVKLTLVLTEETKKLISKEFTLKVDDSIFDDDAIESTNEFTALTTALGQVQNIDNRFNEVNAQFNTIEKLDLLDNDLMLFASYQSGNFNSNEDFTLYIGNDTNKCYPINNTPLLKYVTNKPLWDICCFKHDNKICFIGDYKDSDSVWGGNAFLLIETEDFMNYKQTPFKITSDSKNITQTWAPKIFKDNGETYLIYCIQEDNEKYTDTKLLNTSHEKLRMCYSRALDNTLTNWSEPTYFNVGNNDCIIDPFIIKKDGIYHLYGCYDNNAEIRHYTSSILSESYTLQGVIPFPNVTEAPSIIYFNNKYYMFVDSHRATGGRDSGLIQVMESTDLYNWSNLKTFKNTSNTKMRHFAPLVIADENDRIKLENLFKNFKLNNNYIDTNKNILTSEKNNISYFNLASIVDKSTKVIEELFVMPNTIYYKNSNVDSITINKINTKYLNNFDEFHFVLNSFDSNNSITIKNNSNLGGFLPTREDLVINGDVGSVLYSFTSLDKYIKCLTPLRYNPTIKGSGIANSEYIVSSGNDFECKYVVNGKVCVVSYIFKFTKTLPSLGVIATGLPVPAMAVIFAPTLNNTNDFNTYGTFRINDDGNIIEWYGFKPLVDSVVKGSFTYICK